MWSLMSDQDMPVTSPTPLPVTSALPGMDNFPLDLSNSEEDPSPFPLPVVLQVTADLQV